MDEATTETAKVKLVSKDGTEFVVPANVAYMSNLVKETIPENDDDNDEDDNADDPEVPLPNVATDILKKVIDYCEHYVKEEAMTQIQTPLKSNKLEDLVQQWYCEFVKVDKNMMFDLVAAANYMDIKPLLDLTCLAVSILIKGKSAAELREMFNISSELAAEEEQKTNAEVVQPAANGENNNS